MPAWMLVSFGVPLALYFLSELISPFAQIFAWASGETRFRNGSRKRDADEMDPDPPQGEKKEDF